MLYAGAHRISFARLAAVAIVAAATSACEGKVGRNGTGTVPSGTGGSAPRSEAVSASVARRLSRAEIDATVRDLLGDATNPASRFLAEDEYTPFDNDYTRQKPSAALIDSLEANADDIAARVLAPASRSRIVPCTPSGPGDAACFRQVIETVGAAAVPPAAVGAGDHRVLDLAVVRDRGQPGRAARLLHRGRADAAQHAAGSGVPVPHRDRDAEHRARRSPSEQLRDRDAPVVPPVGSAPDDALLDLPYNDGRPRRPRRATRRGDAPARRSARARSGAPLPRDVARLPGDPGQRRAARRVQHRDHRADRQDRLRPADQLPRRCSLPARRTSTTCSPTSTGCRGLPAARAGWLTATAGAPASFRTAAVLAAFSKFSDTSPTQRGILVQTRLLCNVVPPPPANVNVDQPPPATAAACKLDRYAAHRSVASCAGCHDNLDPIGFGLENYDIGGKFRDARRRPAGVPARRRRASSRATARSAGRPSSGRSWSTRASWRTLLRRAAPPVCGGPRARPRGDGRGRRAGERIQGVGRLRSRKPCSSYVASDRFALRRRTPRHEEGPYQPPVHVLRGLGGVAVGLPVLECMLERQRRRRSPRRSRCPSATPSCSRGRRSGATTGPTTRRSWPGSARPTRRAFIVPPETGAGYTVTTAAASRSPTRT